MNDSEKALELRRLRIKRFEHELADTEDKIRELQERRGQIQADLMAASVNLQRFEKGLCEVPV